MSPYEIRLSYTGNPPMSPSIVRFEKIGPAVKMWAALVALAFEGEASNFAYDRTQVFQFVEAGGQNLHTPFELATVSISPRGHQLFRRVAFDGEQSINKKSAKKVLEKHGKDSTKK